MNYSFIFGFKEGNELGYRQVLLIGFALAVLGLGSVLSNLDMEMDPRTRDFKALTELLPLFAVVVRFSHQLSLVTLIFCICSSSSAKQTRFFLLQLVTAILICPFNIIYRSSRLFFLTCLFHCICAPLYKVSFVFHNVYKLRDTEVAVVNFFLRQISFLQVVLPDFFLADQLTSQVQALRSLEFYICYYGWGDYRLRVNTCKASTVFQTFSFIIAVIPYWSRLQQVLNSNLAKDF